MKDIKRCIPQFTFYDKTGIQAYLEAQAEKGWMLEKISFCWVFRRTTPAKIHFFVTYFPKKSAFEAEPSENQRFFWDFCEHAGWKLAATSEEMQIFYNEGENPVPVETDAVMEVEKVHRSAKKSFLLNYVLVLFVFSMQLVSRVSELLRNPLNILADNTVVFLMFGWAVLAVYIVRELIRYFLWYRKAKITAATTGTFAETTGIGKIWKVIPYFVIIVIILEMIFGDNRQEMHAFLVLLTFEAAAAALIVGISGYMKRRRVSAALNRLTVIVLTTAAIIAMLHSIFMMIIKGELFPGKEPAETYEYDGWIYEIYHDELPLKVEDMLPEEEGRYSYRLTEKESVFLAQYEARQDEPADDAELPWLTYTVTEVKVPFLYDWCVQTVKSNDTYSENIYGEIRYYELREMNAAPWGADAAYRMYRGDEAKNEYLLCLGNRIVELNAEWALTEEQMAVAGEKLGGGQKAEKFPE